MSGQAFKKEQVSLFLVLFVLMGTASANPGPCIAAAQQSNEETVEICQRLLASQPPLSPDHVSVVLITQADYLMRRSEFSKANAILDRAFKSNPKMLENSIFRHNWLRSKGALYSLKNDYASALPFYQQALEISLILGREGLVSSNHNNLGGIHSELGAFEKALEHLKAATDIYRQSADFFQQGLTLANMAEIYEKQGDTEQAKSYFESALALQLKNYDAPENTEKKSFYAPYLAHLYEDLSRIAVLQGQLKLAENHLRTALQSYQEEGLTREQIRVYSALSELLLEQGETDQALITIQAGLKLEENTENLNSFSLRNSLINLLIKASQLLKAEQQAFESLALSEAVENTEQQQVFLQHLAKINEAKGDYKQSLVFQKRFQALREVELKSLFNESTGELQSAIDLEKKKNDIASMEIEQKNRELAFSQQRFWLMVAIMALVVVGVLLVYLLRRRSLERQALSAEIESHQQQLKQLSVDVSRVSQVLASADVPLIFTDDTGRVLYTNRLQDMGWPEAIKHVSVVLPDVWRIITDTIDSQGGLETSVFIKNTDVNEAMPTNIDGIWIHPMQFMQDSLVMVLIGNEQTEKALQATDHIKKYTQYNNLLLAANQQAKDIKISHVNQLAQASTGLSKLLNSTTSHNTSSNSDLSESLKTGLVDLMVTVVETWRQVTKSGQIELAEQSGLWVVSIDDGRLRTRTMDKYMSRQRIPETPRWRQVIKTTHFVLSNCKLDFAQRKKLNEKLDLVMNIIKAQATSV